MPVALVVGLISGVVCTIIASNKGRNPVGWFFAGFFLGLIGLIIAICMSNLKEETSHRSYVEQENRRLREQLRQEQIKAEAFRAHAMHRLDAHDQRLGVDTRSDDRLLAGSSGVVGLLHADGSFSSAPIVPEAEEPGPACWYYAVDGQNYGPVSALNIVRLLRTRTIPKTAMVWMEGMPDWATLDRVPEFNGLVNT